MPSAYLQWRFHSGERVVARGPLVFILTNLRLERRLYVKLKDRMSNSVDPDETAH